MAIRPADPSDSGPIAKLILLAIQDIANQLTGKTTESDVLRQLEAFLNVEGNRFSRSCILVEEIAGEAVGMILCYHGSDSVRLYKPILDYLRHNGDLAASIDEEADEDEYYIDAIAVDPSHQGKGIAKRLIAAAETKAAGLGYDKIALNVEMNNSGAHALYLKLGYEANKVITIHGKPYRHMVKPLPSFI
ncbi:GNAT family N-acetyltransferase [Cohnella lupini]|uniref:Ribosomal protein S18 acetylase RimI-like enzyme n=1 Tax=Cohnella lupini TaxID=1294267 RepID=A0A3D9IQR1_9BACL|nr:GNAT family N-acetyltransferase [Cohnella lupini]RED64082.1 ribosomal protein S18 acetylase RimI-like enzyme [Cohnella lupini]